MVKVYPHQLHSGYVRHTMKRHSIATKDVSITSCRSPDDSSNSQNLVCTEPFSFTIFRVGKDPIVVEGRMLDERG